MAKDIPTNTIDAEIDYVAQSDRMIACSIQPTSYAEATGTYDLATAIMTPVTDFPKSDDTSGRKIQVAAKNGVTIDHSGTATHVALVKTSDSSLRLVTICNSQSLTQGGTVDFPTWKFNPQDGT